MVREVVIYQMGKVGSSAIKNALEANGLHVDQTHFLDIETLRNSVGEYNKPTMSAERAEVAASELRKNLLLHNKIVLARAGRGVGHEHVNVITLVREPFDWYFSYLIQNFDQFRPGIENWVREFSVRGGLPGAGLTVDHLLAFFEVLARELPRIISKIEESSTRRIQQVAIRTKRDEKLSLNMTVFAHLTFLVRPHIWLDRHFAPLMGVDLLKLVPSPETGCATVEHEGIRTLLIRYEQLESALGCIAAFCGLESLSLKQVNVSGEKPFSAQIKQARMELVLPEKFRKLYYSSPYCKAFSYPNG